MTPFEVTLLSVTLNAARIVPSANNRFPQPNVTGYIFSQNASAKWKGVLLQMEGHRIARVKIESQVFASLACILNQS